MPVGRIEADPNFLTEGENTESEQPIPASIRKEDPIRKPTNAKDIVATTRLDLSLIPPTANIYLALALMEGHLKYGGFNFSIAENGVQASVYIAALKRHLTKFEAGEWCDAETLVPHLASIMACCAIAIDAHERGTLKDDRMPAMENISEIFDRAKKIVEHLCEIFPPEQSPGRYTEQEYGTRKDYPENLSSCLNRSGSVSDRSSG